MKTINIIIHGLGRLGSSIANLASEGFCQVVYAVDNEVDEGTFTFPTYKNFDKKEEGSVIVDASHPGAILALLDAGLKSNTPIVICTTGMCQSTIESIYEASKVIPIFLSSNMSLGVSLQSELAVYATKVLGSKNFDIEIVEAHHSQKLDAPSGTAITLANSINAAADGIYNIVFDRSKNLAKRGADEIGVVSVRGGSIVGEHKVIFAGADEVIEITHRAYSRDIFARGALAAARFLHDKKAGLYTMADLLEAGGA